MISGLETIMILTVIVYLPVLDPCLFPNPYLFSLQQQPRG
ncbi:MAG: hypothetical protein C5S40_07180 [ANME-2 cluster archaeon]|nr:hypothetical protein [ANME-2 cluster archaeon]